MKIFFALIFGVFFAITQMGTAFADDSSPVGWHWYNYVDSPLPDQQQEQPNVNKLTPTQTLEIIQKGYQEALNAAVINPTEQNVAQYLAMQGWIANQSAAFAGMYPKALLDNPQLDNRIQNPTEQMATQLIGEQRSTNAQAAVKKIAASNGILFFYRGGNRIDESMCQVVSLFAKANQIAIIPVSVDGQVSASFPDSRIDSGQAQNLGIQYFPATILVNTQTRQVQPLAYGFKTQDELLQQFLLIANNFRASYMGGSQ